MKLLLTSVFRPFGVDDDFNRKDNPWEQMHSSVTRAQGVFSFHTHNRSYGLSLMAENLKVPTTVLDLPTLEEFKTEVAKGYTHVGISFIVSNFEKAAVMAKHVRQAHPETKIFIGGHGAQISGIESLVPCDDVCRMEGVSWLRRKMGENPEAPVFHPALPIEFWRRVMGIPMLPPRKAVIVPGVGCLNGCNFCSTSHYFQGYKSFFQTTQDLFDALVRVADTLGVNDFWLLDENFLENRDRVLELIDLMERHNRPFSFDLFSSLSALSRFTPRELVRLGAQFIWIGIETKRPLYKKTAGLDARALFSEFRRHGISLLASSIFFFDHHDRQTLAEDLDYTISLEPDFTFFTALSPCPGTPLWDDLTRQGRILQDVPMREWTSQGRIWFDHPVFSPNETRQILDAAYEKEFQTLGPCLQRFARTKLEGYRIILAMNDPALRERLKQMRHYAEELRPLLYSFERFAPNHKISGQARTLRDDYRREFGPLSIADSLGTLVVHACAHIENGRVRRGGKAHQPRTFIDHYRPSHLRGLSLARAFSVTCE